MRNETKLLTALAASLALTVGSSALAQNLPRYVDPGKADNSSLTYFVKNVSGVALRCAYRINNGAWSKELNFPANYEFGRWTLSASETLGFACRPPMVQGSNRLVPGKRYIVRNRNGQIQLVLSTL